MFDQLVISSANPTKTHKSWTVALSAIVQTAILGIMILIPLIYTEALPKGMLNTFLVAPAPPPPPPPPQPVVKTGKANANARASGANFPSIDRIVLPFATCPMHCCTQGVGWKSDVLCRRDQRYLFSFT